MHKRKKRTLKPQNAKLSSMKTRDLISMSKQSRTSRQRKSESWQLYRLRMHSQTPNPRRRIQKRKRLQKARRRKMRKKRKRRTNDK